MSFCGNCGKKLNEGVKFCPACGTPVNREQQVNVSKRTEETGRLVVTTEGNKGLLIFCGILLIIFAVFFWIHFDVFAEIGKDIFNKASRGELFGGIFIVCLFFQAIIAFISTQSHCKIYEDRVVGITRLGWTTGMKKFDISYDEILNVTEMGKILLIHTSYTTYEILAQKHRTEAVREIRARISHRV